jgi:hypothetical protein
MIPSVATLLECLPEYKDEWIVVHPKQSVGEIINEILEAHKEFSCYYDEIALYFDGDTVKEICSNISEFLKRNIRYKEEKESDQTTSLPAGLLTRGHGDCKHYSSFAGGVLNAINRLTGKKIKWCYRFASYDAFNPIPHHVFVVVQDPESNSEIWIDPTPGSDSHSPVWQVDKKVNVSSMPLRRNIAGIETQQNFTYVNELPVFENEIISPELQQQLDESQADAEVTPELQGALEVLLHYSVINEMGEVNDSQLKALSNTLPMDEFAAVADARQLLQVYITNAIASDGGQIGSFFSDLWKGVKKVTLSVPRTAFLNIVLLNVFGWATKLYNSIYNDDGTFFQPNQQQLYDKWNSLGGDWAHLLTMIQAGHNKNPILGNSMGVAAAAAPAAWVVAATAIIAALTPLVSQLLQAKNRAGKINQNVDPKTGLPYGINPGGGVPSGSNVMQWLQSHPVESIGIAAGIYFLFFDPKNKII